MAIPPLHKVSKETERRTQRETAASAVNRLHGYTLKRPALHSAPVLEGERREFSRDVSVLWCLSCYGYPNLQSTNYT